MVSDFFTQEKYNRYIDRQLSTNDCAISVIKTIFNLFNINVKRHDIQQEITLDEEGADFDSVKSYLASFDVSGKYNILDINKQDHSDLLPCIAMIEKRNRNHYVIIEKQKKNKFLILDPVRGSSKWINKEEFFGDVSRIKSSVNEELSLELMKSTVQKYSEELKLDFKLSDSKKDIIDSYNKIQYLKWLEDTVGFESKEKKAVFLKKILSANNGCLPPRFKHFELAKEDVLLKAPIVFSYKNSIKVNDKIVMERNRDIPSFIAHITRSSSEVYRSLKQFTLVSIFTIMIATLLLFANQAIIDEVSPAQNMSTVMVFLVVLFFVRFFELLLNVISSLSEIVLSRRLDSWLVKQYNNSLLYYDVESISAYSRGELVQRLNDLFRIKNVIFMYCNNYIFNIVVCLLISLTVLFIHAKVFYIVSLICAIYAVALYLTAPKVKELESKKFSQKSSLITETMNVIEGHDIIKKNKLQPVFSESNEFTLNNFLDLQAKSLLISKLFVHIPRFIGVCGYIAVIWISMNEHIEEQQLSLGQVFTLMVLSNYLISSLRVVLNTKLQLQEQTVVIDRFLDFISGANGSDNVPTSNVETNNLARIDFNDFSYKVSDSKFKLSIKRLSIQAGDRILLDGLNGSGKSTFLKILSGSITRNINGGIRFFSTDNSPLNEQISKDRIMLFRAEDKIFNESIQFNINFTNSANNSAIYQLIKELGMDDFISPHNRSLNSWLEDNEDSLSTGQKRKILVLRALMSDADVLIFDEIFRGIDRGSVQKIVNYLNNISKQKIVIYTTHETIENLKFNRNLHISDGELVENDDDTAAI